MKKYEIQPTIREQFYNPYCFVPLSNNVFNYTEEEKYKFMIANDVPFKNGISGKIHATFTAKSPFCVKSNEKENCNINGKYIIPSTSIKGMIRSVFDIITLSNISHSADNSRFSMRNVRSDDYDLKKEAPKSGFLILLRGDYFIIPCKSEAVLYETINEEEGVDVKHGKTVEEKYKLIRKKYKFQTEDDFFHYWFFSGFMNNKKHEYDFKVPKSITQKDLIPLNENEFKEFRFINEIENKNKSWAFWKKEMLSFSCLEELQQKSYKGLAPCFYREQIDKYGNRSVKDLGFSYLYRIPYQKTIHDCLPNSYKQNTFDMSQALFGFVLPKSKNRKEESLRGRVRFSNAFIKNAEREGEHTFILGSPKPTYFPFYLQKNGNSLQTYKSENPIISGWKRYLLHSKVQKGEKQNKGSESSFIALKAGATFTTEIYVHNVLPYELGALIAALTFCNHKECFHSLGYAKPFGYGKMKLEDVKLELTPNSSEIEELSSDFLMKEFENKILSNTQMTPNQYHNYLWSLFKIASGDYKDKPIRYPRLDNYDKIAKRKKSEFDIISNEKKSLDNFSPITK